MNSIRKVITERLHTWCDDALRGDLNITTLKLMLEAMLAAPSALTPVEIEKTQQVLARAVAIYASAKSPVYSHIDRSCLQYREPIDAIKKTFVLTKSELADKDRWYTSDFPATSNHTSGTTGAPFEYRVVNDFYVPIEQDHHYKAILDEFGLIGKLKVLYMAPGLSTNYRSQVHAGVTISYASCDDIPKDVVTRVVAGHGCKDAEIHHIVFDTDTFFHINAYCDFVIQYCVDNKIDVILASGGFFEILCTNLIASNRTEFPYLCKLLSNTGDRVNPETLKFLVEAGVADHWCDHMRCWDGGAGFFTCKAGNHHLHEELAHVWSTNGKLASIDFFNYSSPFINYTNGDYCNIGNKWEKCDCGRWYRPFEFHNRRSRSNRAGKSYYDTNAIHTDLTDKYGVKFVSYHDNLIMVEDSVLAPETKDAIIRDMAKEQIVTQFFSQPNLKAMGLMAKPQQQYEFLCLGCECGCVPINESCLTLVECASLVSAHCLEGFHPECSDDTTTTACEGYSGDGCS